MPQKTETPKIALFASDLDGTLLGKLDATQAFWMTWKALGREESPLLCYNTGRMVDDTIRLVRENVLPPPDYLICGVGTEIYDYRKKRSLKSFTNILEEGWDLERVKSVVTTVFPTAVLQPKYYQTKYKSSWFRPDATPEDIEALDAALGEAGLDINIVYSSNRDLDILPKFANKGNALVWLLKHLKIPRRACLVAGDTGNDSAMILKKDVNGLVVGNAQPELLEAVVGSSAYLAREFFADGVLEGLQHFGVVQEIVRPEGPLPVEVMEAGEQDSLQHFIEEEMPESLSKEDLAYLKRAYEKALDGLRRNITPMGFSACSIPDNESRGTDENYHSVWARDGSIAVVGSIELDDEDIRVCQRRTLTTLLDHVSTPGQIPANVSIHTGEPDYSGVGGICSIDSGLWVIIAFYEFVRETEDLKLLRQYMPTLQRAMDWLSAHDSNNDGLLEIPEAGDWTDLFGRSYNVLYDEVLWFRCNICFGRMQEMLGDWNRAGDYLRWASVVKAAILHKFWPSTEGSLNDQYTFADKQRSLGDTNYLIAQVTPFDFDWRCDVYGNILAVLFNVLDIDKAKIAFRFMWGVGVNDPYPVANLYDRVGLPVTPFRAYLEEGQPTQ